MESPMVFDELELNTIYTVVGKEDNLLKLLDVEDNSFYLYPGYDVNDYVHCKFDPYLAFKFMMIEINGTRFPIFISEPVDEIKKIREFTKDAFK